MYNLTNPTGLISGKRILLIFPPYPHFAGDFVRDPAATLSMSMVYAGELIEQGHLIKGEQNEVSYFDCQLHDIRDKKLGEYDYFGMSVMGGQNIVSAYDTFNVLVKGFGIDPSRIFLGGQGIEYLFPDEFKAIFPQANFMPRQTNEIEGYWNISLERQIEKFPEEDIRAYFGNELTLLFSQGCVFPCTFCAADKRNPEQFYNTQDNFGYFLRKAKQLGIRDLSFYATSLDFFQQWFDKLKNPNPREVLSRLEYMADAQEKYGVKANIRALARKDTFNSAMGHQGITDIVKSAGFYSFGIGGEGVFTKGRLEAIRKDVNAYKDTPERQCLQFYETCQEHGFIADNLYVLGFNDILNKGRDPRIELKTEEKSILALLTKFPNSVMRLYVAKEAVPGNDGWPLLRHTNPETHKRLMNNPNLILNIGYEVLANPESHPSKTYRKLVNHTLIKVASFADERKQLVNYHTIPILETDGYEILDMEDLLVYKKIIGKFAPDITSSLTLENMPDLRSVLNRRIDRDK